MYKISNFPPGPQWGSLQCSPDSLAGEERARCPLPKNPTPALGTSGLGFRPFGPKLSPPPCEGKNFALSSQNKFRSTSLSRCDTCEWPKDETHIQYDENSDSYSKISNCHFSLSHMLNRSKNTLLRRNLRQAASHSSELQTEKITPR